MTIIPVARPPIPLAMTATHAPKMTFSTEIANAPAPRLIATMEIPARLTTAILHTVVLPSNPYDCEDGNPCTVDLCDLDAYQNISYYFTQEENTLCNPEAMFEIEVHSTVGGPEGDLLDIITFLFMQDGCPG